MDIPGLSTLYSILKRNIDRENDVLAQRQALAGELVDNCHKWAEVLIDTFSEAVRRWETEGREAAEREIMAQEMDFTKLDYWSLEATSPMLLFLKEDARFKEFAHSCERFYKSTLSVKRLVYGDIERHPGEYVSQRDVGISGMVELWGNEVERMLRDVKTEHMKVRVLLPK